MVVIASNPIALRALHSRIDSHCERLHRACRASPECTLRGERVLRGERILRGRRVLCVPIACTL
jgi:hypothetical protein